MELSPSRSEQPRRRQRAPTITIDTTAVCAGEEERKEHKQHGGLLPDRQATPHSTHRTSDDENIDVRPTSPHNVSSPSNRGNSQNFLSVPGSRSRGNSLDSTTEDGESTSIGTYFPSSQDETLRGDHNPNDVLHDTNALKSDPGTEADFGFENNKFAFSPGQLGKLLNPKSLDAFYALGGLDGLERGLRTDRKAGLSIDQQHLDDAITFEEATTPRTSDAPSKVLLDQAPNSSDSTSAAPFKGIFADRKRSFSNNQLPERKPRSIIQLAWTAYYNRALILLTVAAIVSPAFGLYRTFGVEYESGIPKVEWAEGVAILVAIVIVAVPEGLPLAVTSTLAFATTRMLRDNILVRLFQVCETMGNATTICSGKIGTLKRNKTVVVSGTLGTALSFGDKKLKAPTAAPPLDDDLKGKNTVECPVESIDDVSPSEFVSTLSEEVKDLLLQSIVQNTSAFEGDEDGHCTFIGSKIETALLEFARNYLSMGPVSTERSNANVVQVVPFDSSIKCTATVVKLDDSRYRMYVKGASEILFEKCDRIVSDATKGLVEAPICADNREALEQATATYASQSLRTIGLVYRDFESWPPKDSRIDEDNPTQAVFEDVFRGMVFLAIVGIQDPLRKCVLEAVKDCQNAGVYARTVTGDNLLTAKAIAADCGILVPGGVVMESPTFRKLSKRNMDTTIPKLRVLARSSPKDKRMLIKRLKELGETIAVTGDGTNDAPALRIADVGFLMGITGTEVSQEATSIILMDDNYASIVKAFNRRRTINDAINDAVNKATKGLLRCSVAAKLLAIIPAFAASDLSSTLPSFLQFLGVNLIMGTLAALDSRSTFTKLISRVKPTRENLPTPTRRKHDPFLPEISSLMAFSLFISSTAAQSTQITADVNWRQHALDTLSKLIVSCAVLLAPTIILLIAGCIVLILLWLEAEGTLALFMLGMASVFATIRPAPESGGGDDDCYIRLAIGMAYILFMLAYCRLVVLRNRYGKGFCTIAVVLGALATITGMAIPAVREYWVAFTNLNPTFALSLAIPSSFFLGDLAVYIIIAVNHHNKDGPSTPSQLEASSPAVNLPSPRERAYRLRDIPMRRFRNPYGFGSDDLDSDAEVIGSNDLSDDESSVTQPESTIANRFVTWVSRVFSKRKYL